MVDLDDSEDGETPVKRVKLDNDEKKPTTDNNNCDTTKDQHGSTGADALTSRSLMLKENSPPNVTVQPSIPPPTHPHSHSHPIIPPFMYQGFNAGGPMPSSFVPPSGMNPFQNQGPVVSANPLVASTPTGLPFGDPAFLSSLYGPASSLNRDFMLNAHMLLSRHPLFQSGGMPGGTGAFPNYPFPSPSQPGAYNPFLKAPATSTPHQQPRIGPFATPGAPVVPSTPISSTAATTSTTPTTKSTAKTSPLDVNNLIKKD